jgi:hypothetical protein
VAYHFKKNGDKILQTVEQWARVSRNSVINGSPVGELIYGSYSRQGAVGDLAVELPKLQKALQRYGPTYAPQKFDRRWHNGTRIVTDMVPGVGLHMDAGVCMVVMEVA